MTAAPMPQVTVLIAWQHGPLTDPNLIDGNATTGYSGLLGPDNIAADGWTIMSRSGAEAGLVTELPAGGRGRQHELAVFEAATRQMRFDNSDGRFNPWNTASPYYGWLTPGRLMRVLAQWNLVVKQVSPLAYTRAGTLTSYTLSPPAAGDSHRWFPVQTGRRYSFRIEAADTSAGNKVGIQVRWYQANGAPMGTTNLSSMVSVPTSGTAVATLSDVVPPAGAHSGRIYALYDVAAGAGSGTATFSGGGAWPVGTLPTYAPAVGSPVRFTGHIHTLDPEWPDRRSFYVDAEASDLLRTLNTLDLPGTAFEVEVQADNPAHYWPLSEGVGATVANDAESTAPGAYRAGGEGPVLGEPSLVAGSSATSMGLPLAVSDAGHYAASFGNVLPATGNFTVECAVGGVNSSCRPYLFRSKGNPAGFFVYEPVTTGAGVELVVTGDNGTIVTVVGASINDGKPHLVAVRRTGATSWTLTVDNVTVNLTSPATTLSGQLDAGATVTVSGTNDPGYMASLTMWSSSLSTTRLAAHYAAFKGTAWAGDTVSIRAGRILDYLGVPAALRSLDTTGVSPLAAVSALGGTALAHLQAIERAEAGALYVDRAGRVALLSRQTIMGRAYDSPAVTFGDLPGQAPFQPGATMTFNDSEVVNEVTAGRDGGLTVTVVDAASRTDHGPRSRDLTSLLLSRDTEVLDRANFELATYADPRFVLRNLDVWPLEATGLIEQLLGLDLLQLVDVARADIVGTALDQPSLLEHIGETFTSTDWRLSIAVSPHQAEQFWILGVSQLGVNTRLGF